MSLSLPVLDDIVINEINQLKNSVEELKNNNSLVQIDQIDKYIKDKTIKQDVEFAKMKAIVNNLNKNRTTTIDNSKSSNLDSKIESIERKLDNKVAELNGNNLILESKIDNFSLDLKNLEVNNQLTQKEVIIKKEVNALPEIEKNSPDQLAKINNQIDEFSKTLLLITNEINTLKTTISGLNNKINQISKKQSVKQTVNRAPIMNNNSYNIQRTSYQNYSNHKGNYVSEQDMRHKKNESPKKEQKKQDDGWTKVTSKRKYKKSR